MLVEKPFTLLERYPHIIEKTRSIKEAIIANIIMIGQESSEPRVNTDDDVSLKSISPKALMFSERIGANPSVDECTTDMDGNPVALIKGQDPSKAPIVICAHMDTAIPFPEDNSLQIIEDKIIGPGIADNSVSVGMLASLPEILDLLDIRLNSDLYIVGFSQSIGKKNLKSARQFLENWDRRTRGAVLVEGVEIGRMNYYSLGMIRAEIQCQITGENRDGYETESNAVIILNEAINRILEIRIPQKPRIRINIGRIDAGLKYGDAALSGILGVEVRSDSLELLDSVYGTIEDIVHSLAYEKHIEMFIEKQSNVGAYSLGYDHPLVKSTISVMEELNIKPNITSSESELSLFLSKGIPAVTLALTKGRHLHKENARIDIETMYTGISQIIGVLLAIDEGVCDE